MRPRGPPVLDRRRRSRRSLSPALPFLASLPPSWPRSFPPLFAPAPSPFSPLPCLALHARGTPHARRPPDAPLSWPCSSPTSRRIAPPGPASGRDMAGALARLAAPALGDISALRAGSAAPARAGVLLPPRPHAARGARAWPRAGRRAQASSAEPYARHVEEAGEEDPGGVQEGKALMAQDQHRRRASRRGEEAGRRAGRGGEGSGEGRGGAGGAARASLRSGRSGASARGRRVGGRGVGTVGFRSSVCVLARERSVQSGRRSVQAPPARRTWR